MKLLTAIPVYNEERHVEKVLREVLRYSPDVLVVNDGSTDRTAAILERLSRELEQRPAGAPPGTEDHPRVRVISHPHNRGYGAALISAFAFAIEQEIDVLVTMDCDGQHEPGRIAVLLEAIGDVDIVSGSRYLRDFRQNDPAPEERRQINRLITDELNARYGLQLTDSFCGFKAYRRSALACLRITETGWGMPLQLWVQAARLGLRLKEVGVPRVYLDPNRAFGGVLNDAGERLAYYRAVLDAADREADPVARRCGGSAALESEAALFPGTRCTRESCW
jgi:dolichol-phosphate mannosyltransferase